MINVWRNIRPTAVTKTPLAIVDAASVQLQGDSVVTFEIRYRDRVGENYILKHQPGQRFYYFPAMERDEAMLIKVWDSSNSIAGHANETVDETLKATHQQHTGPVPFSFHCAFNAEGEENEPDRESIEVRTIAFFDEPELPQHTTCDSAKL